MMQDLTAYYWIIAKVMIIFSASAAGFTLISKFFTEARMENKAIRLRKIDSAIDFPAKENEEVVKKISFSLLSEAGIDEILHIADRIEGLPERSKEIWRGRLLGLKKLDKIRNIAVSSASKEKRIKAIKILGGVKTESHVSLLISIIDRSGDKDIIYAGIQALGRTRDMLPARYLISLLGADKFSNSKIASILETFPVPVIIELLKRKEDKDPRVRFWVATILAHYPGEAAASALKDMALDGDPNVRAAVCESLGKIGAKESLSFLYNSLQDDFWFVRLHAVKALGYFMSGESITKILPSLEDRNWWVRYDAKEVLKKYGQESIPHLRPTLKSRDRFARNSAAEILEELGYANRVLDEFTSAGEKEAGEIIADMIKAEGYLWLGARLRKAEAGPRLSILKLIEKTDKNLFEEIKEKY